MASARWGEAFLSAPPQLLKLKSAVSTSVTRRTDIIVVGGRRKDDAEVSVFDAGDMAVSWEDYKKTPKPDEFKVCVCVRVGGTPDPR